jgi:glycosyltransferase involved in cell wall biosynthesis
MSPPLSVVMVVRLFSPWVGGMERQALKLAAELNRSGIAQARIVTGRWFRDTPKDEVTEGVPVHRHTALSAEDRGRGLRKAGAIVYAVTLFSHLWRTRKGYDVIHVHGLSYHTAICRLVMIVTGKPMVVKLANTGEASDIAKMRRGQHFPGTRALLGVALSGSAYVSLNGAIKDDLERAGVDSSRIVEIPNGVELADMGAKARETMGTLRLVFVGRLHRQKDLTTLLEALAVVNARSNGAPPMASLDIIGEGPDRDRLEHEVDDRAIRSQVRFHGAVDDVTSHLAAADVLVLPSRSEGISNALLEAMSASTPAIVSDIPGNVAVVTDGVDGFVFPAGDVGRLADLIECLASDSESTRRVGRQARQRIESEYALPIVARRYVDLYERVLAETVETTR